MILFLFSIISALDIPITSGEEPTYPIIYLVDNITNITSTIQTPCISSSIFSIIYQIISNLIIGSNNAIPNPCNESNNLLPSYYFIFPLITLINEWMWFHKL